MGLPLYVSHGEGAVVKNFFCPPELHPVAVLVVGPHVLADPILLIVVCAGCGREMLETQGEIFRAHVRGDEDDVHYLIPM